MKDLMEKMMEKGKKKGKEVDRKEAKMAKLKELHRMMSDELGEDMMGDMKKVTVAAKTKKGLKAGLEKAEELLDPEDEE